MDRENGRGGAPYRGRGVALVAALAVCTIGYVVIAASSLSSSWSDSKERFLGRAVENLPQPAVNQTVVTNELTKASYPLKRFAYMFYVTSEEYACSALQLIDGLVNRLATDTSSIDIVILHPEGISDSYMGRAHEQLGARAVVVDLLIVDTEDPTWMATLTKLQVFQEWGYDRVVFLDSDAVAMQNLDHLFHLPSAPLYAPTAYWLPQPFFASTLMVIEPSNAVFDEMIAWANAQGSSAGYDMDILNGFFNTTARYLPGEYTVLNSDFGQPSDASNKLFNSTAELAINAKFVHFSCMPDGSYGKPWSWPRNELGLLDNSNFDPLFRELFEDYWEGEDRLCSH